ncbi:NAD-dependent epimerase/dehydratase family protein [Edwardsiella tarda]|nr:NAD-dependent epimerase/dehydratase family protein [Edwardsiella tarda]GAC62994.1 dTDP-glucose 4,6-dehydratase RfbB [Edwardsiella tarda ATCC 15947 = NBRC 105688]STD47346.1 dTDP-glucose 4,6-dehydratase [Edwardsiella tarda]
MIKNILIVGASGFIALNIIEELLTNYNVNLTVYGRSRPKINTCTLNFVHGELIELPSKLKNSYSRKFTDVIYLVNNIPVNGNVDNYDILINENKNAIDYLSSISDRFVFFSSGGRVYKSSEKPHHEEDELYATCIYGKSKIEIEEYVAKVATESNIDHLIIRPSNPYGRYQNVYSTQGLIAVTLGKIMTGRDIEVWGAGSEIRDYIFIKDFIKAFLSLLMKPSLPYKVFNIGSGHGTSTLDIIHTILNSTSDLDVIIKKVDINRAIIPSNILSIQRLEYTIGQQKMTSLSDGIKEFISYLQQNVKRH